MQAYEIYFGTEYKADKTPISPVERYRAIEDIKEEAVRVFGGYFLSFKGTGGYSYDNLDHETESKITVHEESYFITLTSDTEADVVDFAGYVRTRLDQESVMLRHPDNSVGFI